jgi:hypothetical protein
LTASIIASMLAAMVKATFRLPRWELERLREQSERQRRALNSVVIDVIARGLGEQPHQDELLRALGPMVARPALAPFSPRRSEDEGERPRLTDALDWTRGDR